MTVPTETNHLNQSVTAAPAVLTRNYGRFGATGKRYWTQPNNAFTLWLGSPGSGKSYFLQSNPAALSINFDRSPKYHRQGQVWPVPGPNGEWLDENERPMLFNWATWKAMEKRLIDAAAANQPRPACINLDSLKSMIVMARTETLRKYGKTDWSELHGPAGYDTMYDLITGSINNLRDAGYGVGLVAHIITKTIPVGTDAMKDDVEIDMFPGLYGRIFGATELQAVVEARTETNTVNDDKTTMIGGVPKVIKGTRTENLRVTYITVGNDKFLKVCKTRPPLPPTIRIAPDQGWSDFERAYLDAIKDLT